MAIALVVAVVAIAYGSQAPSLGVAEFAPAARQQVDPPPTTANADAPRAGGSARRQRATTSTVPATTAPTAAGTETTAPTTLVARGRACVGEPPRQIEDPMSPPCIPTIFEGDNGGATSRGVSSTEIRVGIPSASFANATSGGGKSYRDAVDAMFEFFNRRFEFYGRRLVPVYVDGSPTEAVSARAQGAQVAAQGVFGALTGAQEGFGVLQPALLNELTRNQIVTVTRGVSYWWEDRSVFDPAHPYLWSVYPSSEDLQANLGAVGCLLAGKPAAFAGDTSLQTATRRFGVVAAGSQLAPSARVLIDRLAGCSDQPLRVDWASASASGDVLRAGLTKLRDAGVTTAICVCDWGTPGTVFSTAHSAGYHPEWITVPVNIIINEGNVQSYRRSGQISPPIQLQPGPKSLPVQSRPWYGALQSVAPNLFQGDFPNVAAMAEVMYEQVLLLASGIQGAGPALTPETFAAALMSTQFPNPGAGAAPYWQPSVGFGAGDHSLYDDYAVAWWSDQATGLDVYSSTPAGSWCYVGLGARHHVGSYPADLAERLFDGSVGCR